MSAGKGRHSVTTIPFVIFQYKFSNCGGPKIYKAATAELRRNTPVIILGKGKRSKGLSGSHGDEGG